MCSSSSSRRRWAAAAAAAAAAAVLMGHLLELLGADLSQMSGLWASAATSAAKGTHLKGRLPRFSHTKGRRLPASRSLGPPHQARLPRSAPEFRPATHYARTAMTFAPVSRPQRRSPRGTSQAQLADPLQKRKLW